MTSNSHYQLIIKRLLEGHITANCGESIPNKEKSSSLITRARF